MSEIDRHELIKWAVETAGIGRFGHIPVEDIISEADTIISWYLKQHEVLSGYSAPEQWQYDSCCRKSSLDRSASGFHFGEPSNSSSVTGEESRDSAATDPCNDATPGGGARHA